MCIYFSSNQWAESADDEHGLTFHFCIQVKWFVISFSSAGFLVIGLPCWQPELKVLTIMDKLTLPPVLPTYA